MNKDYLWNRLGEPDPEIERLEQLLGAFRSERPAPALSAARRGSMAAFGAAAAVLLCVAGSLSLRDFASQWEVAHVDASGSAVSATRRLAAGQLLQTGAHTIARLTDASVGVVEVQPNSRLRLLASRHTGHRMSLERGEIQARIWAPPRLFQVDTPSATAVDLGCAYTLDVDDNGAGLVLVTAGWVSFEHDGQEVFIPAGAACRTMPGIGPGTPYFTDAPEQLRDALASFDFEAGGSAALDTVLGRARTQDALTLWHLLSGAAEFRPRVYDRLAALVPPPENVTREGILRGEREMLDRWWDRLGLGDASWWRVWQSRLPAQPK